MNHEKMRNPSVSDNNLVASSKTTNTESANNITISEMTII